MRTLVDLPKTDLHVHLEGSIRAATVVELADKNKVKTPPCLRDGRFHFRDLADFIAQYGTLEPCLSDVSDFRRVAYEFCEDEAAEGIRYCEVTFTLPGHGERFGDWHPPLEAVLDGLGQGAARFGVSVGVVLDIVRGFSLELAQRTLDCALHYQDRGVVALGLAGLEVGNPPERFAGLFRQARDAGLHSVPHAGEALGAESVRGAVDSLGAERIGHGIRVVEDPWLVEELRTRGVPLEVCVTSNVRTGVVPSIWEHPLPRLLEAGLVVTLNSDDPSLFDAPLAGEYEIARSEFGLSDEELADVARNGIRASFADEDTKRALLAGVERWLTDET
jgi:adenosine deaminase